METRTIAQLRALKTPGTNTKYCLPEHENYIAWQYDPLDKTTPDDGKTCIVTATGKRIKKKMIINIVAANSGSGTPSTSTGSTVTPAPPSWVALSPFNDYLNTATFIPSTGYPATEHEYRYRITGGSFGSWITATSNVISLPAADIATGDLEVRVKAATGRDVSTKIYNYQPFTLIPDAPPTVVSATVTSSNNIQVVFSENVTVTLAGWSFRKNGSLLNPLSVDGSGNTWNFAVFSIAANDTITRSYSSSAGNTVDGAGNAMFDFTNQPVTNGLLVTPAAPTNFIVDDDNNTATITLTPGYSVTDHEVSINSGTTYNALTSLPVYGLTGDYAIGSVRFRVKAVEGVRSTGAYIANAIAYTEGVEPTYPRAAGQTIDAATTYSIVSNGSANNATNLNAMSAAHKWSDQMKEIVFPSGQMNYSDNTWVEGLKNVRYKPSSGIMQWYNTGGNEWEVSHQPILTSGILNYNKKANIAGTLNTGYLFSTATAGASSITASATGLVAGDRVFLAGYECQGAGWPPNPRHFEWKVVQSVVGTTITFTTPLERSYNSLWKDWNWGGGYFFGKPRIFKIPANYAQYVEIKDAEMLIQEGVGNAFQYQADTLILDNVEMHGGIWPSENRLFRAIDVFGGSWELDKCVGTVDFYNVTTTSEIQGATGVQNFNIYGGTMGGYMAITPQNFYAEGVTFEGGLSGNAAVYPFEYYTGCDTWTFKDCIFPNVQTAFTVPTLTFTVSSVSGGNIVLPDNSDPQHANHKPAKLIYQGSTITSGGNSATVTDIIHVSGNYHLVLSNLVGTVSPGQVWSYKQIKSVVDLGGNQKVNGTPITISLVEP